MSMPVPPSLWQRIVAFTLSGAHGKIELDVRAGQIVGMRLIESVKPDEDDGLPLPRKLPVDVT